MCSTAVDGAKPVSEEPSVWCFLGDRTGDNNQALALAEALGWPFEVKRLDYTILRKVPNRIVSSGFFPLTRSARSTVAPPYPDLIIGVGQRGVPVARAIRTASGGRTRTVVIGWPRCSPAVLDLVVTTANYPVPSHSNVLKLPIAMSRRRPVADGGRDPRWAALRRKYPGPWWGFLVGGPSRHWDLTPELVERALVRLTALAAEEGATLAVVTSRRSSASLRDAIARVLEETGTPDLFFAPDDPDRAAYQRILGTVSRLAVTGDSVAMLSDAVASGAEVALVLPEARPAGRWRVAASRAWTRMGGLGWERDLEAFWAEATDAGLVGSMEDPVNVGAPDVAALAAAWVKSRLALTAEHCVFAGAGALSSERSHPAAPVPR
ncbi:MAG: ELM1/GtrOC1 family putative glycosyltransferase [Pseudomonadota bacterium]